MENLHSKLLAFQKKGIKINKDAVNPHFKSKYASLTNILENITPTLNELGITISHSIQWDKVITSISDGKETVTSDFPLFGSKAQDFGSSISYARRYNLGALLNLDIDDDDDGNVAQEAQKVEKKWFNQPEFTAFMKVKDNYANWDEAVKAIRQKYALNKEMEAEVRAEY